MEILSAERFDLGDLAADLRPIAEGRTVGLHGSDIIRDIDNRILHPGQRLPYDQLTEFEIKRMGWYTEMGFIWEDIITHHFRNRMLHRGEGFNWVTQQEYLHRDILWTPDGLDIYENEGIECKATWVASWKFENIDKYFWSWKTQMCAYADVMGVEKYRLFVFWVNGDYKSSGPYVMDYRLRFSPQEKMDTMEMLVRHGQTMRAA